MKKTKQKSWLQPEFILVVLMLIFLTIIIGIILIPGYPHSSDNADLFKDILDFKKNILSVVLTAFGAWVGAGAAYFFGRENLRQSADSMLELHRQTSGLDKLKSITVRDIPPKPLEKFIHHTDTIEDLLNYLKENTDLWFIPVKTENSFDILHEDSLFRFLQHMYETGEPYEKSLKRDINDLFLFLKSNEKLNRLVGQYIEANMGNSLAEMNEKLQDENVYLAIVLDYKGNPTHYFTTSDLRKVLLKL
jgi:hypothetical protein